MLGCRLLALRPLLLPSARALAGRPLSATRAISQPSLRVQRAALCTASAGVGTDTMATANGSSAALEEVEALRQQLESLQVRECGWPAQAAGGGAATHAASAAARCPPHAAPPSSPARQTTLRKKEAELETVAPYNRTYGRTMVATVLESDSQGLSLVGKTIRVGGWVKTGREAGAGAFAFLEVNDGSCFQNIQVWVLGSARAAGLPVLLERRRRCVGAAGCDAGGQALATIMSQHCNAFTGRIDAACSCCPRRGQATSLLAAVPLDSSGFWLPCPCVPDMCAG